MKDKTPVIIFAVLILLGTLAPVMSSGAALSLENDFEVDDAIEWAYVPCEPEMVGPVCEVMNIQPLVIDLDVGDSEYMLSSFDLVEVEFPSIRQRPIDIHPAFFTPFSITESSAITLNLFDDLSVVSNIQKVTEYVEGVTTIRGDIEGSEDGFFILSYEEGRALGIIEMTDTDQRVVVRYNMNTGFHHVLEVDIPNLNLPPHQVEDEHEIINESSSTDVFSSEPFNEQIGFSYTDDTPSVDSYFSDYDISNDFQKGPDDDAQINVMIVYTPAARLYASWAGANMNTVIGNLMETANTVLENSETGLDLNLVYSGEVDYQESGSPGADLRRLTCKPGVKWTGHGGDPYDQCPYTSGDYDIGFEPHGGYMDEVHTLRNRYAADLVAFLPMISHIGGSAWVLRTTSGRPDRGFSQTGIQYSLGSDPYTFIHEIGHNLGCHHHPDDDDSEGLFQFSHGHRWKYTNWLGITYRRRSVMAYNPNDILVYSRRPYFSNPDVTHNGIPTGTNTRNNAETIRQSKHIVASYRNYVHLYRDLAEGFINTSPAPLHDWGTTNVPNYRRLTYGKGSVTFTAQTPQNSNWAFSHWTGDIPNGYSAENPIEIFIDGDIELTAHFCRPQPPHITSYSQSGVSHHIYWDHDSTQALNNPFSITGYRVVYRRPNESTWRTLSTITSGLNGVMTHSWTPNQGTGTYTYAVQTMIGGRISLRSNTRSLYWGGSSGGGGGPISGCPYVSVWNGEEYVHDNNILIASEHQEGVVEDNYILQNTMVPKDGYYSLKIEEFEQSQDFFDTFSLYTIDHREGYSVGTTPDYEYMTYKDPVPPISAYDGYGQDVLEYVSDPDGEPMHMPEGSSVVLNYGVIGNALWEHQKLVVRSHGFESYTEQYLMNSNPSLMLHLKTSLYVSLRVDGAEWIDVTVIHPRNHPSDIVIPLRDVLQQFVPGGIGEVEVQIVSTQNHYLDFVGLDNSVQRHVNVQEAPLVSAMLNGVEDVMDILLEGNGDMVTIIPGEYIILTFEIPRQRPGQAFRVRNFMLFSRGYYHLYEGESTAVGSPITVQPARNDLLYKGGRTPPLCSYLIDIEERFNMR